MFDSKAFYDGGEYVYVAGTLTGEGVTHPNNTTAITCYREHMQCLTYSIEQIGANQVGRLDSPVWYPITKWDANEIIASGSADGSDCRKLTISIVRRSELVTWVEEPINQAAAACIHADTRISKWTIEDSPFHRHNNELLHTRSNAR